MQWYDWDETRATKTRLREFDPGAIDYEGKPVVALMGYAGAYPRPVEPRRLTLVKPVDAYPNTRGPLERSGKFELVCKVCGGRFRCEKHEQPTCGYSCMAQWKRIRRAREEKERAEIASMTSNVVALVPRAKDQRSVEKICEVCRGTFMVSVSNRRQRTCSRKCGSVIRERARTERDTNRRLALAAHISGTGS